MANYAENLARAHRILDLDLDSGHSDGDSSDSGSEERTLVIDEGPVAGTSGRTVPPVGFNQGTEVTSDKSLLFNRIFLKRKSFTSLSQKPPPRELLA